MPRWRKQECSFPPRHLCSMAAEVGPKQPRGREQAGVWPMISWSSVEVPSRYRLLAKRSREQQVVLLRMPPAVCLTVLSGQQRLDEFGRPGEQWYLTRSKHALELGTRNTSISVLGRGHVLSGHRYRIQCRNLNGFLDYAVASNPVQRFL